MLEFTPKNTRMMPVVRIGFSMTKTSAICTKLKQVVCCGGQFTGNCGFMPNRPQRLHHPVQTRIIQEQGGLQFSQVFVLNSIVDSFGWVIAVFTIHVSNARVLTITLSVIFVPLPMKISNLTAHPNPLPPLGKFLSGYDPDAVRILIFGFSHGLPWRIICFRHCKTHKLST